MRLSKHKTVKIEPTTCKQCGSLVIARNCPTCGLDENELWGVCGRDGCYYCGVPEVEGCAKGNCENCSLELELCPLIGIELPKIIEDEEIEEDEIDYSKIKSPRTAAEIAENDRRETARYKLRKLRLN